MEKDSEVEKGKGDRWNGGGTRGKYGKGWREAECRGGRQGRSGREVRKGSSG